MMQEAGNHPFFGDLDNFSSFEWSDLDGKKLDIAVTNDECGITVAGFDRKTGMIYVLHQQVFHEKKLVRGEDH